MTFRKFYRSQSAYSSGLFFLPVTISCAPLHQWCCFLLFRPPSLCQQVPSINTGLSVIGVTIGSCRYNAEGPQSAYRLQPLKCYHLPIHKHTHTHTSVRHRHTHLILFASASHLIIADTGKFGINEIRSNVETKNHLPVVVNRHTLLY